MVYKGNKTKKWVLVVLDPHGQLLAEEVEPRFVPAVGTSITTEKGFFNINEVSLNYSDLSVVCYTEDYDLFD